MNPADLTSLGVEGGLLVVLSLMLREIHALRASFDAKAAELQKAVANARERLSALESLAEGQSSSLFRRRA